MNQEIAPDRNKNGAFGPFLLLLFMVGLLFAWMSYSGLTDSFGKPSLEKINQQRALLAQWPHVTGRLDRIDIMEYTYSRPRYPSGTDYWPEVKYHYSLGQKHYKGDCLRKEISQQDNSYFCSDPLTGIEAAKAKLTAFLPADLPGHVSAMPKKKEKMHSFFPNRSVEVYYDPDDPKSSMLDGDWKPLSWWDYYNDDIFMVVFCAGISIMMLGVSVFIAIIGFSKTKIAPRKKHASLSQHHVELPKAISVEEQWKVDTSIPLSKKQLSDEREG